MILVKLFDINERRDIQPPGIWDISHKLNYEYHQNGNDSYYLFEVVTEPTGEEQGGEYITDEEAKAFTDWLLSEGAEIGDNVIISHWW